MNTIAEKKIQKKEVKEVKEQEVTARLISSREILLPIISKHLLKDRPLPDCAVPVTGKTGTKWFAYVHSPHNDPVLRCPKCKHDIRVKIKTT